MVLYRIRKIVMTEFYNRETEKDKRQELRNSMPKAEVLLWMRLKGVN